MATNTSNFNFQGIGIVNLVDGDSGGPGCMDQNANNYNPAATENDDSCLYDEAGPGCTNPSALNYNPAATSDDDSCVFDPGGGGCLDDLAVNTNPAADFDDGSCVYYEVPGCMDPLASNYDSTANVSSDTCEYLVKIYGCTDTSACNYDVLANADCDSAAVSDGYCTEADQCFYPDGCTNPGAPNYDPNAQCDDGSCIGGPGEWGCTDSTACNYNPLAVNNDGTCNHDCYGCMDNGEKSLANGDDFNSIYPGNEACNYDEEATVNDGSCLWNICCPDENYLNGTPEDPECCSFDESYCQVKKYPGCMDDGQIRYDNVNNFGRICVMDPFAFYDYTLSNGTVINADANGIIAADPDGWPGAGNGDHPDFVNQSNCITVLYTNNGGGDPSAAGLGSFTPDTPALNYDPFATVDDGSCRYEEEVIIKGCLNENACNYDCVYGNTNYPCNDGVTTNVSETCIYARGCTDCDGECKDGCMRAYGDFCFGEDAESDKGCCVQIVEGCKDSTANNFNCETGSTSTTPCTGANLVQTVNVQDDPSSCIYTDYGCTDPLADNYGGPGNTNGISPPANIDDGSCIYTVYGCMDPIAACTYDVNVTVDDGSCCYGPCGCTDPLADNYIGIAVGPECDDGSCVYDGGCTVPPAPNLLTVDDVGYSWTKLQANSGGGASNQIGLFGSDPSNAGLIDADFLFTQHPGNPSNGTGVGSTMELAFGSYFMESVAFTAGHDLYNSSSWDICNGYPLAYMYRWKLYDNDNRIVTKQWDAHDTAIVAIPNNTDLNDYNKLYDWLQANVGNLSIAQWHARDSRQTIEMTIKEYWPNSPLICHPSQLVQEYDSSGNIIADVWGSGGCAAKTITGPFEIEVAYGSCGIDTCI